MKHKGFHHFTSSSSADLLGCPRKIGKWLVNGLFHLLINGIYWGYNPFTDHLLTSWDIQAGFAFRIAWILKKNASDSCKICWNNRPSRVYKVGALRCKWTSNPYKWTYTLGNWSYFTLLIGVISPLLTVGAPPKSVCIFWDVSLSPVLPQEQGHIAGPAIGELNETSEGAGAARSHPQGPCLEDHPKNLDTWLITTVIVGPLRTGLWDPFQMGVSWLINWGDPNHLQVLG